MHRPGRILGCTVAVCCLQWLASAQTFTKVISGPVVTDGGGSHAASWGDYDNDGVPDLFVTHHGAQNDLLCHNDGGRNFTKISSGALVNDGANSYGAAWGDYDNNGTLDIFVCYFGTNILYANDGFGNFTAVTNGVPFSNDISESTSCSWVDYDTDGHLDLFVTNWRGRPNFLYHNNGDGTFTRVTSGSVAEDVGDSVGGLWGDYDGDSLPDLFVVNKTGRNSLYHNLGGGAFARVTDGDIANDVGGSFGAAWGDYDNDGDLDLYVANADTGGFLYRNNGDGTFTRIRAGDPVTDLGRGYACAWGDYNNDGYLDLAVADFGGNNRLYRNNGDGTFAKITTEIVANELGLSAAVVWEDYDNDGALDLHFSNHGANNFLYHNEGNTNHWIKIRAVGGVSNRTAIGAKVRIQAVIHGEARWQLRDITGGDGVSGASLWPHFGLGDAAVIQTVQIEWPSGIVQELRDVPADQLLTVYEPARLQLTGRQPDGKTHLRLEGVRGRSYLIQSTADLSTWPFESVVTNVIGTLEWLDETATGFESRFYRAVGP